MNLAVIHQRMKAAASVARLPLRAGRWTGVTGNVLGQGTGSSIDFQDQRQYMPGDDPRHINWQAYARSGQYTMKLYRQEVTPRVDLIFDTSGSMFLDEKKTARTWELLYFCLESALRLGASVKLHTLGISAEETPLERALAYDWPENPSPGKPDFSALLHRVPLRAGSLRVVVSDLLSESPPEQAASILSSSRGRAILLAPYSREEAQPDWQGNIEFEDSEMQLRDKRRVEPDVLGRYLRAYENHFAMWREQCARRGIAFARVTSDHDFIAAMRAEAEGAGAVEI
ncbi:MAG: DUF58 domain-containing protein [Verrucomicrobia bacterium]|nr:DUF58 domain-containing protein [Verrucomicrobiota bacterium]